MPDDRLLTAFDDCLDGLKAGQPLETVLARHPDLRSELAPMLRAAEAMQDYGARLTPPRHVESANRARFLARAAALRQQRNPARGWARWGLWAWAAANRLAVVSLVVTLVLGLSAYGAATAATESLPGEPLYAVKRTVEQVQLALTADGDARARLEREFAQRRLTEVERLRAETRTANVTFGGALETMNGERWSVAGVAVRVSGETAIEGTPLTGLYAEVEGALLGDGTVAADRVVVTGQIVSGELQSQSASEWQVGGVVVRVDAQTLMAGTPRVGDQVTANARRLPDGQLLALSITMAAGHEDTPPPVETLPGPTLTPAPSSTNAIAGATETQTSPVPTAAPASRTPTTTQAPQPSATPRPTDDNGGEDDGDDNSGPSASHTPEPDETDEPDETEEYGDDGEDDDHSGEVRWEGTVEATGAVWVVGGQSVTVNAATEINGSPQIGDTVEVRAERQEDGSLLATRIDKK